VPAARLQMQQRRPERECCGARHIRKRCGLLCELQSCAVAPKSQCKLHSLESHCRCTLEVLSIVMCLIAYLQAAVASAHLTRLLPEPTHFNAKPCNTLHVKIALLSFNH
jgi:hypothetical protein